jgi:DNA-binding FadR family transcriptional regulator
MLSKFKHNSSITNSIALQIEQLIADSTLLPEQKIPSERLLSSQLQVSRATVREALKELQGRGLIVTKQGKGSFVASIISTQTTPNPFMHLYFDHHRTLYDVYEVREQLEGQAAFLAAQRATQKDLYRITKAYNALQKKLTKNRIINDQKFHKSIVGASHNPVLVHLLSSLEELLFQSVQTAIVNLYHIDELKNLLDEQHREIYQAILNKQPQRAQSAAINHVKFVSENIKMRELRGKHIVREAFSNE